MVPMAEGADQEPSGRRATTTPEPNRAVPRKPALKTVRMARPCADGFVLTCVSFLGSFRNDACCAYLCVDQDLWRNNLIGSKGLSRVYKGCENLASLSALACEAVSDIKPCHSMPCRAVASCESWDGYVLLIDEGSGLFSPRGMVAWLYE
jgi:hypothetical protein